jgi:hypothetical protein
VAVATGRGSVSPTGLKSACGTRSVSGVFAVRSSRQIRFILITGQLPHDDSPAPTATHTLQKFRRVCEPIAWLVGRDDFTRGPVMKHRHDSIVAIANTREPVPLCRKYQCIPSH